MKNIKSTLLILLFVASTVFYSSCKRELPQIAQTNTNINSLSNVQVFSATVKALRNYIYVDNTPISGAALAYGGIYPGTAYSFTVAPGSRNFLIKDTLVTSTQVPLTFTQAFDAGKSYTVFTYDTITSIKQITVTNNITIPKDTTAMFRFANFVYNTAAIPSIDVYSSRRGNTLIFSNVASNSVTDFISYASGTLDTLSIYNTGTTTPLLAKLPIGLSLTPTRSYTSAYSGSYKSTTRAISTFITY